MSVYHMATKFIKKILTNIKSKSFRSGACCGINVRFDENARCTNETGKKDSIIIGDNCMIRCPVIALGNGKIQIGNNTYIGCKSRIGAINNIVIGNDVIISSQVHIIDNNNHPTEPARRLEMTQSADFFGELWSWTKSESAAIHIQDNVWIGERCTILKGVTIGKGSIIGAGSVVTHNIPDYVIAAGNPARVVKQLSSEEGNIHE